MELNQLEDYYYWPCTNGILAVNIVGTPVAPPDKLGTDPMTYGGINKWMSPWKSGGSLQKSTRFSMSVENERTDAGWDGQTCLARPNSQARTGQGNIHSLFSVDHEQVWQPYPVDP